MKDLLAGIPWSLQIAFVAGVAYMLFRRLQRDVNGLGGKARDLERKRIRAIAIEIEMAAAEPDKVRRLAQWLYEST